MDLTIYYQKIRQEAAKIADDFPVIVSAETGDGGKAGVCTEAPRAVAARMLVDGKARLGTTAEAKAFREAQAAAKRVVDELEAAAKVQFTVVPAGNAGKRG